MKRHGSPALNRDADRSIKVTRELCGRSPTGFIRMRNDYGTLGAMTKLVENMSFSDGFLKTKELGMTEWSLESLVLKHSAEFKELTIACAKHKLDVLKRAA